MIRTLRRGSTALGHWRSAVSAIVVLSVLALGAGACGDDDDETEVFSFMTDDLCGWISEAEVAEFVREAYAQSGVEWNGGVAAAEPDGSAWDLPGRDYCRWVPTGGGYVIARGLDPSMFFDPVEEFSEIADEVGSLGFAGFAVSGHPDLADGVIAANAAFGRYGFWLEGTDEVLGLEAVLEQVAEDPLEPDGIDWAQQQRMLFHIANSFLTEMGWTS